MQKTAIWMKETWDKNFPLSGTLFREKELNYQKNKPILNLKRALDGTTNLYIAMELSRKLCVMSAVISIADFENYQQKIFNFYLAVTKQNLTNGSTGG